MTKIVKLSGRDVKKMVDKIVAESKRQNPVNTKEQETPKPVKKSPVVENNTKKTGRVIRLTESEMIDFLDKLSKKVENGQRRRLK